MARLFALAAFLAATAAGQSFPHDTPGWAPNMNGPACELALTLKGFGSHKGHNLDGDYYYNGAYYYTKIFKRSNEPHELTAAIILTPDPNVKNETLRTKWSLIFLNYNETTTIDDDSIATCSDCSTLKVYHKGFGTFPEWPVAAKSGTNWVLHPASGRSGTVKPTTDCCKRQPQPADVCSPKVCNGTSVSRCGSNAEDYCHKVSVMDPCGHPSCPSHYECHCQYPEQVCQQHADTIAQPSPGRDKDDSRAEMENLTALLV